MGGIGRPIVTEGEVTLVATEESCSRGASSLREWGWLGEFGGETTIAG